MTDQNSTDHDARLAFEPLVRRGPVTHGRIDVRVRCFVQRNGDGTVTVSVPRLSYDAWTGKTEAEARMLALLALDDPWGPNEQG